MRLVVRKIKSTARKNGVTVISAKPFGIFLEDFFGFLLATFLGLDVFGEEILVEGIEDEEINLKTR
jgi:hypothetical protein